MLATPSALQSKYEEHLRKKSTPNNLRALYQKWLRYYLDFCQKYHVPPKHEKSLPPFIQKLQDKQQSQAQQEQAIRAVTLYYELLNEMGIPFKEPLTRPANPPGCVPLNDKRQISIGSKPTTRVKYKKVLPQLSGLSVSSSSIQSPPGPFSLPERVSPEPQSMIDSESLQARPISGASWKSEYSRLANEIHVRHYSSKTLKTYQGWVQKLQTFTRSKPPELLSTDDVIIKRGQRSLFCHV